MADGVTRTNGQDVESNRQRFFSPMGRHLSELYHVVRHELAYREAVGDLLPGEVAVEDVVDSALLSAYRELVKENGLAGTVLARAVARPEACARVSAPAARGVGMCLTGSRRPMSRRSGEHRNRSGP